MNHPFANKVLLTLLQTQQTTGRDTGLESLRDDNPFSVSSSKKLRPFVPSTMAIGEEGGSRFPSM